jgi:hypothetical protein
MFLMEHFCYVMTTVFWKMIKGAINSLDFSFSKNRVFASTLIELRYWVLTCCNSGLLIDCVCPLIAQSKRSQECAVLWEEFFFLSSRQIIISKTGLKGPSCPTQPSRTRCSSALREPYCILFLGNSVDLLPTLGNGVQNKKCCLSVFWVIKDNLTATKFKAFSLGTLSPQWKEIQVTWRGAHGEKPKSPALTRTGSSADGQHQLTSHGSEPQLFTQAPN